MDAIAAIATAPGPAGIAVVRVSGPDAYRVAERVFVPASKRRSLGAARGYTALFGHFWQGGRQMDETVALCFRAPKSYTGEDVIELSVHGGAVMARSLLAACLEAGARMAGPGEFTRRAFLNGRISLTQAEAVMDLIEARGQAGARAAAAAMDGALYRSIRSVCDGLLALAGHLAAAADYPEEGVPALEPEALRGALAGALARLEGLLESYDEGCTLRRGVRAVLAGSPNVGKSTLLNLLCGQEKAIVTPIPGTTRDVVEQEVQLDGIPLLLADTAGLRQTDDPVEAEGVRRSGQQLANADLILAVFDAGSPLRAEDLQLAEQCRGRLAVGILNKTDLPRRLDPAPLAGCFARMVELSAAQEGFSPALRAAVVGLLEERLPDPDAALLANERQRAAAQQAAAALRDALDAAQQGFGLDAVSVCVDEALQALYRLTGEDASEAVIEEVFSRFCVGK